MKFFSKVAKFFLVGALIFSLIGCDRTEKKVSVESNDPYANSVGDQDVVVYLHGNTLSGIADELVEKQVVASPEIFLEALHDRSVQPGYYLLKTKLSADTAIDLILDTSMKNRVGRLVIPEGTFLSSKTKDNGKIIPGIFNRLADASEVKLNGKIFKHSEESFFNAATSLKLEDLRIPTWEKEPFINLPNDFRKIEGLIRPGAWDDINPLASPKEILKQMVEESSAYYDNVEGFVKNSRINLNPYEKLILTSIVEHEVTAPQYYPMVARVILNRIKGGHKLEMDSTINYFSANSNLNLYEGDLKGENAWNTYKKFGLPVTPIGAVSDEVLAKSMHPAEGKWLFFVTVDDKGTTLFADTLPEHEKNIKTACKNGFITVGCGQ